MPFHVRHLPCTVSTLVSSESVPPNTVLFNPSYAHPILYLRGTRHSVTQETNFAILYNMIDKKHIEVPSPMHLLAPCVNLFQGIEDLRICWGPLNIQREMGNAEQRLWFSGTTTHASDVMTNELIVGHFSADLRRVERLSVVDIGSLPVKNVCPFIHKGRIHLLDTFKKDIFILEEDSENPEKGKDGYPKLKVVRIKKLTSGAGIPNEGFRGSTSPVHLHGNTWGCIVHDIIFNDNTKLVTRLSYMHVWLEFDIETGDITFVSSPFWIAHWGIEYASGIHYDREKDEVTLYLGVADRTPLISRTTLHDLRIGK